MCDHLGEKQMEDLAERVAAKMVAKRNPREPEVKLTNEEKQAVKHMFGTGKWAVRIVLWMFAATVLWILKDVYLYLKAHINLSAFWSALWG